MSAAPISRTATLPTGVPCRSALASILSAGPAAAALCAPHYLADLARPARISESTPATEHERAAA